MVRQLLKGAAVGFLDRHHDHGGARYRMREKLFAIGDDFWIETEGGERAFKVDGKALRVRDTFVLEDGSGAELFKAQAKKLHIRDTMKIEHDGDTVATIQKALITPLRQRFSIEMADGTELKAKGNILDHEYKIERETGRLWPRSQSVGSASATPMGSRSPRARMMLWSWRWPPASMRWRSASRHCQADRARLDQFGRG